MNSALCASIFVFINSCLPWSCISVFSKERRRLRERKPRAEGEEEDYDPYDFDSEGAEEEDGRCHQLQM